MNVSLLFRDPRHPTSTSLVFGGDEDVPVADGSTNLNFSEPPFAGSDGYTDLTFGGAGEAQAYTLTTEVGAFNLTANNAGFSLGKF